VLNLARLLYTINVTGWSLSFTTPSKLADRVLLTVFFLLFAVMAFYNITHRQKTTFRDLSLITLNGRATSCGPTDCLNRDTPIIWDSMQC
jgi:hypothetical protein